MNDARTDYDAQARNMVNEMSPLWIADQIPVLADALRQAHAAGRAEMEVEEQANLQRTCERLDFWEDRAARLEAAIASFFRPGPGVAVPEWYETTNEPYQQTWNAKLDALKAALEDAR